MGKNVSKIKILLYVLDNLHTNQLEGAEYELDNLHTNQLEGAEYESCYIYLIICTLINWKVLSTNLALVFKDFISNI